MVEHIEQRAQAHRGETEMHLYDHPAEITNFRLAGLLNRSVARINFGGASLEVCRITSPCGDIERRFVMKGPSGVHSLLVEATDLKRLNAHWTVFASAPENQIAS